MKKIELLAPAGNIESIYAAVESGADAVYLGGNKFSARAYAQNFDDKNMESAVEYCHIHDVKVYVTINTVIKGKEINAACEYARFLYNTGVDALIVQDIGFSFILKDILPNFELHASTQMTIHNGKAALFLKKMGFKRIVLSRELSLAEIEHISSQLGIETEIFIHGALCICYSGQCLMSSIIGGRSGNRGRCAQPCRLPYEIIDEKGKSRKRGYLLSPKDICTIENIGEIIKSGTSSLKIEGRMKRPEYVAGVVREYRNMIDNFYENCKSLNDAAYIKHSKKSLLQLFNREGFSKAYLFGNTGKDMMSYSFSKNTGTEIGVVKENETISLMEDISVGDGIRVENSGFVISKILKNKREASKAFDGESVKILPFNYRIGDTLYKTSDFLQIEELRESYKYARLKKIELTLTVKFKRGEPVVLCTNYDELEFRAEGKKVAAALKQPLSRERICESLNKTGEEMFKFKSIEFEYFEKGFLPISALNEVRRELFKRVREYVLAKNRKDNNFNTEIHSSIYIKNKFAGDELPQKIICVSSDEQLEAVLGSNFQCICINPFQREKINKLGNFKSKKVYIKVPNIVKEEFNYVEDFINRNLNKIEGIVTGNLGIISRFKDKIKILGDYKLNITNSSALNFYNKITNGDCLSVELDRHEIKDLVGKGDFKAQVLVYGKIELMVSEHCVIGSTVGNKCSFINCNKSCENRSFSLLDRKKKKFVLRTDRFCRSYIYNAVPINLISNMKELRGMGVQSFRADFTDEDYSETKRILSYFQKEEFKGDFSRFTRGHYRNGVE